MNVLFMGICGFGVTLTCFKRFFASLGQQHGTGHGWSLQRRQRSGRRNGFFPKLNRSLLAVSPFLSEFQAPVWSGKSIIVVKWVLSKHPYGGTTPVHAPARVWAWLWAPAAPVFQSGRAYTDSRWYLIIYFYTGTRVQNAVIYIQSACGFMGIHQSELNHCTMIPTFNSYLINATFISPVWIHSSQDSIEITKTGCRSEFPATTLKQNRLKTFYKLSGLD